MSDILIQEYKKRLLAYTEAHHQKHELSKTIDPFAYDPGKTENLCYYEGIYNEEADEIILCTEVKGLRYEERSMHLDNLNEGDSVIVRRDPTNPFNSNNFELFNVNGESLGSLSAELCNWLAPLYDPGCAVIEAAQAAHIEKLQDRSRYAKQGVLFVRLHIHLVGI